MTIAIGCDRRGYPAKEKVVAFLRELGHRITDFNDADKGAKDYPDIALPVALTVARRQCDMGILLDGNGIGMTITASKVPGASAVAVHDQVAARFAASQTDCNILCIGCDLHSPRQIRAIVEYFLAAFPTHAIPIPVQPEIPKDLPLPPMDFPPANIIAP